MLDQQKACLEILDSLVEKGVDITNLSKELPRKEYNAVRKRITRAFGSVQTALKEFGLYETNGNPCEYELYRCFSINEIYKISKNEYEINNLRNLYNLSEFEFYRISKEVIFELKKDALDEFYRNEFPDNIKTSTIRNEFPHIWNYIRTIYGNIGNFMKFYGTPSHIFVEYDYDRYNGKAIKDGYIFEGIVSDVFRAIFDNVKSQVIIEDCRPDFVVGGDWYDAKLTLGTVFHQRGTTLKKYLKHTKKLTIVYAKGKCRPFESDGARFIHISEYYNDLKILGRDDLIERCETFLKSLNDSMAVK